MDWTWAIVVLQVLIQPCLSVLLNVEAEQNRYQSELGGDVEMGCRFQPGLSSSDLKVTWNWISSNSTYREAYLLDNGVEQLASQDPVYRGRAALLREELEGGRALLKISGLRISDSGTYQCLVKRVLAQGPEADYEEIQLSVTAPYRTVTKRLQKVDPGDEVLLSCQADGYPESSVLWWDGHGRPLNASSTSAAVTPQQLFTVTSQIRVRFHDDSNYTCGFSGGYSATFVLPDELLASANSSAQAASALAALAVVMAAALLLALFLHQRRKGQRLKQGREEEQRIYSDGPAEPRRDFWGAAPSNLRQEVEEEEKEEEEEEEWLRVHRFAADVLPQRLQNHLGQPVSLQALVPEPGQTLFLEGPPGSGKTTVGQLLAFSWAAGPSLSPSSGLDLRGVRLLVNLDCSQVKGQLLQEMARLVPSVEEEELRGLAQSCEVLLLLDGYREGNQVLDQSLQGFLQARPGCRVLITARPGQSCTLQQACQGAAVLQLGSWD